MKNLILVAAGLSVAGAIGAYAQAGVALFNQLDSGQSVVYHIYGPETENPAAELSGNVSQSYVSSGGASARRNYGDLPVGTQVYDGGLVGGESSGTGQYSQSLGSDYSVALAAVPGTVGGSVSTANFVSLNTGGAFALGLSVSHSTVGTTGNAGFLASTSQTVTIPGTDPTGANGPTTATLQLYAWFNFGQSQPTSLAAADAAYSAAVLAGAPSGFSAPVSGYNVGGGSVTPSGIPFKSFNLTTVPEPSTIALGVIGAASFLLRRRSK